MKKKIATAPGRPETNEEEPPESNKDNKRRAGNENNVFKCLDCEYFTCRRRKLELHRLRHEQEEEYKCDRCNFSARLKNQVSIHCKNYHREQSQPSEVSLDFKVLEP